MRFSMIGLLLQILMLIALHTFAFQSTAEPLAEREAKVVALLNGYEWQLDEAAFRSLPDDCWKDLLRISKDKQYMKVIRARASIALTLYPNDAVWSRMHESLDDSGVRSGAAVVNNLVLRRRAVEQMCRTFGVARPHEVEQQMIRLLEDADPHTRVKAAQCMQTVMTEAGVESLKAYRNRLKNVVGDNNWEYRATENKE